MIDALTSNVVLAAMFQWVWVIRVWVVHRSSLAHLAPVSCITYVHICAKWLTQLYCFLICAADWLVVIQNCPQGTRKQFSVSEGKVAEHVVVILLPSVGGGPQPSTRHQSVVFVSEFLKVEFTCDSFFQFVFKFVIL